MGQIDTVTVTEDTEFSLGYSEFIDRLFWACVKILEIWSERLGISYEELNIWLFVVLHPLLTLTLIILLFLSLRCRRGKQR